MSEPVLSNVPEPDVDHIADEALPPVMADKVKSLPEQIIASLPAFAVAAGSIVTEILSEIEVHGPTGSFVVTVNITDPEEISFIDGVYSAFVIEAELNTPVPEEFHVMELAPPPYDPLRKIFPDEQII